MNGKGRLRREDITVFLMSVLGICLLSPYIAKTVHSLPMIVMAALCLISESHLLMRNNTHVRNLLFLIVVYISIFFLYLFLGISTSSMANHVTRLLYFFPFILIVPLFKRLSQKHLLFLLIVTLATMAHTMILNYYLKGQWGYRYSYQLNSSSGVSGIINTQYTSAIMLLSGALFCGFLHFRSTVKRCMCLAGVIMCMLFNFIVTQRAITFLLSILMFVLLLLVNSKASSARRIISGFISVFVVLILMLEYDKILIWLADISGSARIQNRFYSIIRLIDAGDVEHATGSSLRTRLLLSGVSIKTFFNSLSNFIIGVGNRMDNNSMVGNHSQLFDEFARYGIFGGLLSFILNIKMFLHSRRMSETRFNTILWRQYGVIIFITILRLSIGTVFDPSIGVVLFITIPILFHLMQREEINVQ